MDQLVNISQIEFLTKLGVEEDTLEILGTRFSFRTLTVDENTQSFENPTKEQYLDDVAKYNAMRIEVLARAITKINGIFIPENMKDKVRVILKRCQQLALNKLFEAYQALVKKQEKHFADAEDQLEGQVPAPAEIMAPVATPVALPAPPTLPPPPIQVPAADEPVNIVNPNGLMGAGK